MGSALFAGLRRTMDQRVIRSWCLYDWANSAFATTVMAALFPPFFRATALRAGLTGAQATAWWGYTAAAALLLIALTAPVLGAVSDATGHRKRYLGFFMGLGILATLAFPWLGPTAWRTASAVFIAGNVGFAGANIFYESLLPHIASTDEMDEVSSRGYALGYVGGGILLVINVLWVARPSLFGMPDAGFAVRASFVSVAVWWGVFAVPLFRVVPDPPPDRPAGGRPLGVCEGFARVARTFREIRRYRELLVFLVAFWVYNDGIGTIIKMATAYGDEIGIDLRHMILALVLTQLVGIPFTLLFGALAGRLGAKRCLFLALGVYALISVLGFFMSTPAHFYGLALLVGTVQGGSQALSRSLFGSMVPRNRTAEFFGFFSTSGKLAGVAGPVIFGVVSQATGHSRLSILALILFFAAGAVLLAFVDETAGRQAARAEERVRPAGD